MMKFETINGTLCRMVEPTPLTPEAQFPCVVRLVQDNTMLGKANIRACRPETLASKRICSELTDDGLFMDGNYTYRYEIIGYPVEEGSHWWALYQIRSGKKVVKEGGGERYVSSLYKNRLFYLNDYGCLVTKNAIGLIDPCSEKEFLDLDETGWQLYEPQPQPEPKESPIDPIERPLRNLILEAKEKGVNIRTWYQGLIFTPESLASYLGNGKYRWWNIGNWELTKRKANMPMPEPAKEQFEVGDWVRGKSGYAYQITAYPSKLLPDNPNVYDAIPASCMDGPSLCLELSDIESKLDPSEVRVKVVLEGTVSQDSILDKASCFSLHTDRSEHIISLSEIEDSELVESLLKAQEEK